MKEPTRVLTLKEYQVNILVNALNEFRNRLLREEVDTIDIDNLIIKIIDSPVKKLFNSIAR